MTKSGFFFFITFIASAVLFFFLPVLEIGSDMLDYVVTEAGIPVTITTNWTLHDLNDIIRQVLGNSTLFPNGNTTLTAIYYSLWAMPISLGATLFFYMIGAKPFAKFFGILSTIFNGLMVALFMVGFNLFSSIFSGIDLLGFELVNLIYAYIGTIFVSFIAVILVKCKKAK